jgi:hypothetical protein
MSAAFSLLLQGGGLGWGSGVRVPIADPHPGLPPFWGKEQQP